MFWLCILCAVLILIIAALILKIILLHKGAEEIHLELDAKLDSDTNTLITISSGDRHMRRIAAALNTQLRLLRKERRRFQNGDLELKEAVTNISHDLRTPLTAICGYLDLLKREDKSEEVNRYLGIIENRTKALKQLTEELFRYSIISFAANDFVYEDINLNGVLEESISAYYGALNRCGIIPKISIPEQKVQRKLDRSALMRIFGNIISNAIKYSDKDLEIILNETGEIIFSNIASQLNEVQIGKLFDRFYTVEAAKKSTGLGLSIAKTLTEQLNGTITASYKNKKLSICIVFPDDN